MQMSNSVTVVGNLTNDPEMRFTASGKAVARMTVADNRSWTDKNDERHEEVSFFDVSAWGDLAEHCVDSLTKGARVVVVGSLQQNTWEDRETGQKRSRIEITASEVAPSLRWATATVTKSQRPDGSQTSRTAVHSAPAPVPAGVGADPLASLRGFYADEEPF